MLQASWSRCWKRLNACETGDVLMGQLIAAYNEEHRKYHTEQHLRECLICFEQYRHLATRPEEVEMAIWFHDSVYDVNCKDNEKRSADWAVRELMAASVEKRSINRIYDLIMATQHAQPPKSIDQGLIIDIDLSILGSSESRFDQYESQIRDEYSYVSDQKFNQARRNVIKRFIESGQLYNLHEISTSYYEQAKSNLTRSLNKLNQ
jgi:predicted metal-dependent HD superfamily phosphohydrolase